MFRRSLRQEKTRFRVAHAAAVEETKALLESTKASNGAGQAEILDAQLTLLQDEYSVVEPILEKIGDERCNAAHAAGQRAFGNRGDVCTSG